MNIHDHPLYNRWLGMMYRCYKPYHSHYKYYGAKGVVVDARWHNFKLFVEDIYDRMPNGHLLESKGYVLDKDIHGGNIYSLDTCVVISKKKK